MRGCANRTVAKVCSAIIRAMSLVKVLKTTLKTIGEQLTVSSSSAARASLNTSEVYFTNNFISKAKQWGLSEKDALDVYLSRSRQERQHALPHL